MTDDARIRELMLLNLFAVFNERDPERRQRAIAANYTEDVIWSDPEATFHGRDALNERAQQLLDGPRPISYSPPRGRFTYSAIWGTCPSTRECLNSRPRSAATTWRWYATDGSPCCTR
jgi:hypothetical protein